ncbi:site-specific integrase [Nonlabens antarcticus]|uniref:site-specific integrase n=1 Tax=Nonlabens antarcticus TaxID=392714 RepID=UPI001890F639|nr:site-specific integrase [Nonlabens antarcticus]
MKITLKGKKLKNSRESLFIEYYNGSLIDESGKRKHRRSFEYLNLYLDHSSKERKLQNQNKENLELAHNILSIRKSEHLQGKYKIANTRKKNTNFLEYYTKLKEERFESKGNYDNWDAAGLHLERYCPSHYTFEDVNEDFVRGFRRYLDQTAETKSHTRLSQNTKHTYYNKFKACLRRAFEENFLDKDLRKAAKSFEMAESNREYLTMDELEKLARTYCKYLQLKNAFLVSCLSGLRWSDIDKLKWYEVRDEPNGCKVNFRQQKTKGMEYLPISQQSRDLMGIRRGEFDKVFKGLKYSATYNAELLKWCIRAGIPKHITFHSARHTNALLLLTMGADIYTVSKRLGHRELRTTEIYAKIIDEKMKEAAELIPELNISNNG